MVDHDQAVVNGTYFIFVLLIKRHRRCLGDLKLCNALYETPLNNKIFYINIGNTIAVYDYMMFIFNPLLHSVSWP